jgi:hypothetical protein
MGFREHYRLSRWRLDRQGAPATPPAGVEIRPAAHCDLDAIAAFDAARSAMSRRSLLAHLLRRAPPLALVAEGEGRLQGFALGRDGRFATQIGPVVADREDVALALLSRASAAVPPPFLVDVPDCHASLRAWLETAGGTAPRGFWRMVRGEARGLEEAARLFALAGPELG